MLIGNKNIKPMPGRCYIRMESLFRNTGQIVIPNAYKTAPHIIGTVEDHNCREEDIKRLTHRLAVGEHVIVAHYAGRQIQNDIYDYAVGDILAIISGDVDLKAISQSVERCRFCGNAKTGISQSIIMWEGRCPRCGRDKYGMIQPANPAVTVSDSEIEQHESAIYKRNSNRPKKIISLAR